MENLPAWLDAPKIAGLVVLILAFVQYFKSYISEKWIKLFAVGIGIILSLACEMYIGAKIILVKVVVNGMIAAIVADTAYGFLAKKGGIFTLPSKNDLEKPK